MIYHLLKKPVKLMDGGRVQWECVCGLNVALPAKPVEPGTAVQTADPKNSADVIECAACYNASDERGETPVPMGAAANERELNPTFDTDLGEEEEEDQTVQAPHPDEPQDGDTLAEEAEEFPG